MWKQNQNIPTKVPTISQIHNIQPKITSLYIWYTRLCHHLCNKLPCYIVIWKSLNNCVFQYSTKKSRFFFENPLDNRIFSSFAIFGKLVKNTNVNRPKFHKWTIFAKPENSETHFRRFWHFFGLSLLVTLEQKNEIYIAWYFFFLLILFFFWKKNSAAEIVQKKNNIRKKK